jgi:hypothetical protein
MLLLLKVVWAKFASRLLHGAPLQEKLADQGLHWGCIFGRPH